MLPTGLALGLDPSNPIVLESTQVANVNMHNRE
jgi:hypothetical protein